MTIVISVRTPPDPIRSANVRRAKADIRAQLRNGELTLDDILTDQPPALANEPLLDLVRTLPGVGDVRAARLNHLAIREQVNLMLPLCRASERTRTWLLWHVSATNGPKGARMYREWCRKTAPEGVRERRVAA